MRNIIAFLLIWIIIFTMFAAVCGCNTERQAIKKISSISARANAAARKACTTLFPPEVTVIHDTATKTVVELRKGDPVTVYSYIDCDSAKKTGVKRVPCPPSVHTVDTLFVTTTITNNITKTVLNREKEKVLQAELDKKTQECEKMEDGRNTWRWIGLAALLVIVGSVVWKFFGGKLKGLFGKIGGLFKKKS